jgi:hypothetical protein
LGKGLRKMPICSSGIAQEEQNNSHNPHDWFHWMKFCNTK